MFGRLWVYLGRFGKGTTYSKQEHKHFCNIQAFWAASCRVSVPPSKHFRTTPNIVEKPLKLIGLCSFSPFVGGASGRCFGGFNPFRTVFGQFVGHTFREKSLNIPLKPFNPLIRSKQTKVNKRVWSFVGPGIRILDLFSRFQGGVFAYISNLRSKFQDSSVQGPKFGKNYLEQFMF